MIELVQVRQDDREVFHFKGLTRQDIDEITQWCVDHFPEDGNYRICVPCFESLARRRVVPVGDQRWDGGMNLLVLVYDIDDAMLLKMEWSHLERRAFR